MSEDGRYSTQIAVVKEECKDADETEIIKEFKRYEEEFLIPVSYTHLTLPTKA